MLSFASATGNLFNRLGKLGLLVKAMNTYQNTQLINMTSTSNGVVAQFNGESDIQALMGQNYITLLGSPETIATQAQSIAQSTINRMVFRDNPRISQNLQTLNTIASVQEVIRQMGLAGASVLQMVVTSNNSTFTGTGNGVIISSVKRPIDGLLLENSFAENLLFTCNNDSYSGGTVAFNEGFIITGTGNQTDQFAFNWPLGSNCQISVNAIDGNTSNGSGNILTNSGFETWSSNVPSNWTLQVGTPGVNINQENTLVYDGVAAIRLTGDGSGTLTTLVQQFDSSSGSSSSLINLAQYSVNLFLRRAGTAPGTGNLTVELIDQFGNQIEDAAGNSNFFNINLTTLTTTYASFSGVFRTPVILPSQMFIRLRLNTAITNGVSVYIDKMSMGGMVQTYTSGPYISVHSGSVPFVEGDYGTATISNTRGSGGTLSTFQTLFDQFFDMRTNDLLLPSSPTPTISDGLIG